MGRESPPRGPSHVLGIAAAVPLSISLLGSRRQRRQSPVEQRQVHDRSTSFAFTTSGYGTRVKGGQIPTGSSTTGFQVIGCTNQAGKSRTNDVAEATVPGLGTASGVKTHVWTTSRDGVVASHSTHDSPRSRSPRAISAPCRSGRSRRAPRRTTTRTVSRDDHDPRRQPGPRHTDRRSAELPAADAGPAGHDPGPGDDLRRSAHDHGHGQRCDGRRLRPARGGPRDRYVGPRGAQSRRALLRPHRWVLRRARRGDP